MGWDRARLEELAGFCEQHATSELIIAFQGRILIERLFTDAKVPVRDVGSVQKSVVSVLVGVLAERGQLAIEAPVSSYLGQGWTKSDPSHERTITIRHLLSMCSGLYDDFSVEDLPGRVWYYNNNAYHQLRRIIERVTGRSTDHVSREILFEPLGMTNSSWAERPGMVDPHGMTLLGLRTTARDLVRFGIMIQAGGLFGDCTVISPGGYLNDALQSSTDLNPSYGYLWWLPARPWAVVPGPDPSRPSDPRKSFGGRRLNHPIAPSAPTDAKAAHGVGGQRLCISAHLGVVLVRLGGPVDGRVQLDEELWRRLRAAAPEGY